MKIDKNSPNLIKSSDKEFFGNLQKYFFVSSDDSDVQESCQADIDDVLGNGIPIDSTGAEMELYAIITKQN